MRTGGQARKRGGARARDERASVQSACERRPGEGRVERERGCRCARRGRRPAVDDGFRGRFGHSHARGCEQQSNGEWDHLEWSQSHQMARSTEPEQDIRNGRVGSPFVQWFIEARHGRLSSVRWIARTSSPAGPELSTSRLDRAGTTGPHAQALIPLPACRQAPIRGASDVARDRSPHRRALPHGRQRRRRDRGRPAGNFSPAGATRACGRSGGAGTLPGGGKSHCLGRWRVLELTHRNGHVAGFATRARGRAAPEARCRGCAGIPGGSALHLLLRAVPRGHDALPFVRRGDGEMSRHPPARSSWHTICKNWLELTIDLDYQSHLYC